MRKLLLFLCCALGWCGQMLSQRSLTDLEEALARLNEQIEHELIAYEPALDSLDVYATTTQDSLANEWLNIHYKFQLSRVILYQLKDDFATADSLLNICFIDTYMDSEIKFNVLYALGYQTIENAERLFYKSEYERGRNMLEFIRQYLPLSLLPRWQIAYASSYLSECFTVPFGDHRSFLLVRKSHLLGKEWKIPSLEVQSLGSLGVLFADYLEKDSAYYYLQEADRLGLLYDLPELRFQCLDELSDIAWEYGDVGKYERVNALADSLADFVQDDLSLMYRYYLRHIRRYERQGKWRQVEMWLHKAEQWCETLNTSSKYYHSRQIYCRTAELYKNIGGLDCALSYGHKALQAWEQDTLHGDWVITDMNEHPFAVLGSIYQSMGDSAHQFAYLDSLVSYANLMNKDPSLMYKTYLLRGNAYYGCYDFDRALKDYEKSLDIITREFSDITPERAKVLIEIGKSMINQGAYQEGLEALNDAYGIVLARYGEIPYIFWPIWRFLAEVYRLMDDPVAGCEYLEKYVHAARSYIQTNWINRDPKEALVQFSSISKNLKRYLGYIEDSGLSNTPHVIGAYDAYLLTTTGALDMHRSELSRIKHEGNELLLQGYLRLRRLEALLDEELEKMFAGRRNYEQLNAQVDSMRSVLRLESKAYGDLTRSVELDFELIKNQLRQDEFLMNALIMENKIGDFKYYRVFLVHPDQSYPISLNLSIPKRLLPDQPDIESEIYEDPLSDEFLKCVWEPIAEHIPAGSTVYYCNNEAFAPIALENIPIGKDSILGNRYDFKRISSPLSLFERKQDLLALNKEPIQAVLYGGLRYDMTAEEKAVAELTYPEDPWLSVPLTASRGDTCFQYLPGTYREVTAINKLLTKNQVLTFVRTGAEGTEQSFLNLSGHAPNILHLATHGYYTGASSFQRFDGNWNFPGLWSGLVLSGGNEEWRDTTTVYGTRGGVLTSYEIEQLDFSNVDLLVLSACNTAKSVIAWDGDIGLVGAFKAAGVKSVLMSLWEVSDKVTQEFMEKFYQELIDLKWDKRVAFEAAKAYIRKRYPEPVYWAGFVLVDG